MSSIILYASSEDGELIREWINADDHIAWIVKAEQHGCEYRWQAVKKLNALAAQEYALWHVESGPLNIPSGTLGQPDIAVLDPFSGGNLPGPFHFSFNPVGRERPESIGRSEFSWLRNRYKPIGKPAPPVCLKWWARLGRFIKSNATEVPWPYPHGLDKLVAYAFPEAIERMRVGIHADANPRGPNNSSQDRRPLRAAPGTQTLASRDRVFAITRAVLWWKWLICGFKCPVSGRQGELRRDAASKRGPVRRPWFVARDP
jgi:hypothetical protein